MTPALRHHLSPPAAPALALVEAGWREPLRVVRGVAEEPGTLLLLSDGSAEARWSYLMSAPSQMLQVSAHQPGDPWGMAADLLGSPAPASAGAPPFSGGLAGLACYELGARAEPSVPRRRRPGWPDLAAGLYLSLLAFDHHERRVLAVGRGRDDAEARANANAALARVAAAAPEAEPPGRLATRWAPISDAEDYEAAVADVVARIAAGEIFQANVARGWSGRLAAGAEPIDLLQRLAAQSPAPFAGYFRLDGLALVSNSPERFIAVGADGWAETKPIKGTRPRGRTQAEDLREAAWLQTSEKDRAENLMIVDLMRNDLARSCVPSTVSVKAFCALESFANVHHLVSTVTGRLAPHLSALDLISAAFPPGSITGAPKVQAMRVIGRHEAERGPYCGSLFWAGFDGAFDSSVLIRTAVLEADGEGWRLEARAGAGIVADSDPAAERAETEAKMGAISRALAG